MNKSMIFTPDMLGKVSLILDETRRLLQRRFGKAILDKLPDTYRTDSEAQKCWTL